MQQVPLVVSEPVISLSTAAQAPLGGWLVELGKLEPTIQGAVVAAAAALSAALLTLVVTGFVTWLQLRHTRKEREKDRSLELKKDVLLDATIGISEILAGIMSMADTDLPDSELNARRERSFARSVRVGAVASLDTVEAIAKLVKEVSKATLVLLPQRLNLLSLKSDADEAYAMAGRAIAESTRLTSLHEDMILKDAPQQNVDFVDNMIKFHQIQYESARVERDETSSAYHKQRVTLMLTCVEEQLRLESYRIAALGCIRKETGAGISDGRRFAEASRTDGEELKSALQKALAEVDAEFAVPPLSNSDHDSPRTGVDLSEL